MFITAISEVPGAIRGATEINETLPAFCCQEDLVEGYNRTQAVEGTLRPLHEFTATSYGFGYGAVDMSIRLFVAVITTYCLIALFYISHTIVTGHTSIAWGSATELIMLALQSKEPAQLGHVSVGLDSMETFRKGVGIRISTVDDDASGQPREKLELVFEGDEETRSRNLKKVEPNTAY